MIGTPFENHIGKNDNINDKYLNKKRVKDNILYAFNEKGKRVFHGAFTGGFSAGYFNTVGSKEGWKPNNNINYNQNISDFMDEEDFNNALNDSNKNNFINCKNILLLNNDYCLSNEEKENFIKEGFNKDNLNYVENINCVNLGNNNNYGIGFKKNNTEMSYKNEFKKNKKIIKMNEFDDDDNIFSYKEKNFSDYNFEEVYEKNNKNKEKENKIEFIKSQNKLTNKNISSTSNYEKNKIVKQFESLNKLINKEKENRDKINLEQNTYTEEKDNKESNILEYNSIQLKILKEKKRFENQQKKFQKFSNPIQQSNNENNFSLIFNYDVNKKSIFSNKI